jgi:hypothetical protein
MELGYNDPGNIYVIPLNYVLKNVKVGWQSGQVLEPLPSKCKALSSNPTTTEKINRIFKKDQKRVKVINFMCSLPHFFKK